jgi:hypothetical protein
MTDTCEECGRPFAKTQDEWFESSGSEYPNGPLCGMAVEIGPMQCRIYTIRRLKARVQQL